MNTLKRMKWALPLALLMALLVAGSALAITIAVDGVRESAWDGDGGQTPGNTTDPDEVDIPNNYDIEEILWTNDTTNFYFLIQTYDNVIFTGNPRPTIIICLDTDNNTSTGGSYANCNNMSGIDRSIIIDRSAAEIYDGDPNNGTYLNDGTHAYQTNITEISVALSDLGLSASNCSQNMPAVVYFDNGTVAPDDNTPDSGFVAIGCGGPTAIQLTNLEAQNHTPLVIAASALLLVLFSGGALLAYKRSRA